MGIVCGLYRISDEKIDTLSKMGNDVYTYIMENYSSVLGKYHIQGDIVFEMDKAWDIARFLFTESDPSPEKTLSGVLGIKQIGSDDSLMSIPSEKIKEINSVLNLISVENTKKVFDRDKMLRNDIYNADWIGEDDWEYISSHIKNIKLAFLRAAEYNDGMLINFH